jgi:cell division septum initiation protein DivIVA
MMKVPANETPREELLYRDISILLQEVRQLRKENEELKQQIQKEVVGA